MASSGPSRSFTGRHDLQSSKHVDFVRTVPTKNLSVFTLGSGTVMWRIWPAVLLQTIFATIVICISQLTKFDLGIPPVMLTVVGVIIGFVISYRASSGYDRYWLGRCLWSDVIKNCRAMGRLVWYHVPLRLVNKDKVDASKEEIILEEKKIALGLIEGFAVALKHHLRGEPDVYYTDLYNLVHPVHSHSKSLLNGIEESAKQNVTSPTQLDASSAHKKPDASSLKNRHAAKRPSLDPTHSDAESETPVLLPASNPLDASSINTGLLPFSSVAAAFRPGSPDPSKTATATANGPAPAPTTAQQRREQGLANAIEKMKKRKKGLSENAKYRPHIAADGDNTPLEIIRCLSEWVALLEERNTVNGCALGMLHNCLFNFEEELTAMERILTSPLPFIYSVHIRTVWLYLFFLPFQLSQTFGYYGIPGTFMAAFFFLGFLAAGEEIEQPFGYDENDLDLDMFCRDIIHADIAALLKTATPNSVPYLSSASEGAVVDSARELIDRKHDKAKHDTQDGGNHMKLVDV